MFAICKFIYFKFPQTTSFCVRVIGNIYFDLGQNDESLKYFLRAIECCQNPLILVNIGNLYFQLRNYQLARNYLQQAKDLIENQSSYSKNNWNLCPANIFIIKEKVQLLLQIEEQIGSLKSSIQQKSIILYKSNEQQKQLQSVEDIEKSIFQEQNGKSIIKSIIGNQDTIQTKIEIEQLYRITRNLQEFAEKIKSSDNFKIAKEIENLKQKENSHKLTYYRSLVWYLYNYLNSMQQVSTGLYEIKRNAYKQGRFEKFIFYLREFLKFTPNIMKYVSMPSTIFNCINEALIYGMDRTLEIQFNNRMILLTNIIKRFTMSQNDFEQQIQLAALELSQELQPGKQLCEQSKFQKFVDKIASFTYVQEEYNQDYYWKKGINDSLIILSYMSQQNNIRFNDNINYNLRQICIEAIKGIQNNQKDKLQCQ